MDKTLKQAILKKSVRIIILLGILFNISGLYCQTTFRRLDTNNLLDRSHPISIIIPKKITVDSTFQTYQKRALFDGIINHGEYKYNSGTWVSEETTNSHFITVEFTNNISISNLTIFWAFDKGSYMKSQSVDLFIGKDKIENKETGDDTKSLFQFSAIKTKQITISQPVHKGPRGRTNIMWITEVEINTHFKDKIYYFNKYINSSISRTNYIYTFFENFFECSLSGTEIVKLYTDLGNYMNYFYTIFPTHETTSNMIIFLNCSEKSMYESFIYIDNKLICSFNGNIKKLSYWNNDQYFLYLENCRSGAFGGFSDYNTAYLNIHQLTYAIKNFPTIANSEIPYIQYWGLPYIIQDNNNQIYFFYINFYLPFNKYKAYHINPYISGINTEIYALHPVKIVKTNMDLSQDGLGLLKLNNDSNSNLITFGLEQEILFPDLKMSFQRLKKVALNNAVIIPYTLVDSFDYSGQKDLYIGNGNTKCMSYSTNDYGLPIYLPSNRYSIELLDHNSGKILIKTNVFLHPSETFYLRPNQ